MRRPPALPPFVCSSSVIRLATTREEIATLTERTRQQERSLEAMAQKLDKAEASAAELLEHWEAVSDDHRVQLFLKSLD